MISCLSCTFSVSNMNIEKKRLYPFERFKFVDTDNTFHNTNLTTLNGALFVTQHICPALPTLKCGLVSEWITQAKPHFFLNEILTFGTAMVIQVFHLFIQKTGKNLAFLCCFCRISTLYFSTKNVGNPSVIQTSTVSHSSVQISCTPNCLLGGCVLLWKTN